MSIFDDWRDIIARDLNWNNGSNRRSWSEATLDPLGLYDFATKRKPLLTDRSNEVKAVAQYVGQNVVPAVMEASKGETGWKDGLGDDLLRLAGGGVKNIGRGMQALDQAGQDKSNIFGRADQQAAFLVGNALRFTNFAGEKGGDAVGWLAKETGWVDEDAARVLGMLGTDYLLTMGAGAAAKGASRLALRGVDAAKDYGKAFYGLASATGVGTGAHGATGISKLSKVHRALPDNFAINDDWKRILTQWDNRIDDAKFKLNEAVNPGPTSSRTLKGKGPTSNPYLYERNVVDEIGTMPDEIMRMGGMKPTPGWQVKGDLPGQASKIPTSTRRAMKLADRVEQHHGNYSNIESAALGRLLDKQGDVLKVNAYTYMAKRYKAIPGTDAANMWNLPYDVHRGKGVGLHTWLKKMNMEDYWRVFETANPNASPQQVMKAIDNFMDEVVYPSIIKSEDMLKQVEVNPKWVNVSLPKKVLADAKKRLKTINKRYRPDRLRASKAGKEQALDDMIDLIPESEWKAKRTWETTSEGLGIRSRDLRKPKVKDKALSKVMKDIQKEHGADAIFDPNKADLYKIKDPSRFKKPEVPSKPLTKAEKDKLLEDVMYGRTPWNPRGSLGS